MPLNHLDVFTIQTKPGLLFNVTNTRQVDELPIQFRSKACLEAFTTCMSDAEGKRTGEDVRATFIGAAKEAKVFIKEGKPGA